MKNTQILLQAEEISTLAKIEATANDFVSAVKNGEIAPLKAWTDLAKQVHSTALTGDSEIVEVE